MLPPTDAAPEASVDAAPPGPTLAGIWQGTATQTGIDPFTVLLTVHPTALTGAPGAVVGLMTYPSLGCGGYLTRLDAAGDAGAIDAAAPAVGLRLLAHEHLRCGELAHARALYLGISPTTPYAACRRALGLAYVLGRSNDLPAALAMARAASRHAGDGGLVRLRTVSLGLLAHLKGAAPTSALRRRAVAMARALEDADLGACLG